MNFLQSLSSNSISKPSKNEIEISIFGKGVGESLVIHLGEDEWIVVDSFLDSATSEPVALLYLKHLGIDLKESVKSVIATHWHDDHVRGIAKIVKECENASFVLSQALQTREFTALISSARQNIQLNPEFDTGVNELYNSLLNVRGTGRKTWASANKVFFEKSKNFGLCSMRALSPSEACVDEFLKNVATLIPKFEGPRTKFLDNDANHEAVVLWLQLGAVSVLLGSDLLNVPRTDIGWKAVVALSKTIQYQKSKILKVPHHGSETGHLDNMWKEMLEERPIALLTPFSKSRIPRNADVKRILQFTDTAFTASRHADRKNVRKSAQIEQEMKRIFISRTPLESNVGMVQIRVDMDTLKVTERLIGNAEKLKAV
jgi:beta-lactamase superfamily II metal-dependent hydrolase